VQTGARGALQPPPGHFLEQARMLHGLETMDRIKYAVLERTGGISVVPRSGR
jgi:uncharacterized membrane protein YcaP (DUF421 family)